MYSHLWALGTTRAAPGPALPDATRGERRGGLSCSARRPKRRASSPWDPCVLGIGLSARPGPCAGANRSLGSRLLHQWVLGKLQRGCYVKTRVTGPLRLAALRGGRGPRNQQGAGGPRCCSRGRPCRRGQRRESRRRGRPSRAGGLRSRPRGSGGRAGVRHLPGPAAGPAAGCVCPPMWPRLPHHLPAACGCIRLVQLPSCASPPPPQECCPPSHHAPQRLARSA